VETDNLIGSLFEAKFVTAVGGMCNVDVNKQLLLSSANARKKYGLYLEEQKKNAADAVLSLESKALTDETAQLKSKKQKLKTDRVALTASADEFAQKAEKEHKLTLIAKSNAMRKAGKEKDTEVEQQLNAKLLKVSNC
jgi:hypothetical protein